MREDVLYPAAASHNNPLDHPRVPTHATQYYTTASRETTHRPPFSGPQHTYAPAMTSLRPLPQQPARNPRPNRVPGSVPPREPATHETEPAIGQLGCRSPSHLFIAGRTWDQSASHACGSAAQVAAGAAAWSWIRSAVIDIARRIFFLSLDSVRGLSLFTAPRNQPGRT